MPRRLEGREGIEVYATEKGQIAIKQDGYLGNDDMTVFLDVNDIPVVIRWLQDVAADAAEIRSMAIEAARDEQAEVRQ